MLIGLEFTELPDLMLNLMKCLKYLETKVSSWGYKLNFCFIQKGDIELLPMVLHVKFASTQHLLKEKKSYTPIKNIPKSMRMESLFARCVPKHSKVWKLLDLTSELIISNTYHFHANIVIISLRQKAKWTPIWKRYIQRNF